MNNLMESFEKFTQYLSYRFSGLKLLKFFLVWLLCLFLCGCVILLPGYLDGSRKIPFITTSENRTNDEFNPEPVDITDTEDTSDTNQESTQQETTESNQINKILTMKDINGILYSLDYLNEGAIAVNNLTSNGFYSNNLTKWQNLNTQAQELISAIETYKDNMDPDISTIYAQALATAQSYLAVTQEGINIANGSSTNLDLMKKDIKEFESNLYSFKELVRINYQEIYSDNGLSIPGYFTFDDLANPQ